MSSRIVQSMFLFVGLVLVLSFLNSVQCANQNVTSEPPQAPEGEDKCSDHDSNCDQCVADIKCYYCWKTKKCGKYPYTILHPVPKECGDSLDDLSWRTCKVNAQVLVIVFASLFGLIGLIVLIFLVYCCCIRKCLRSRYDNQIIRWNRSRVQLEERQAERRQEREHARAAIRAKYGLGSEGSDYKRF